MLLTWPGVQSQPRLTCCNLCWSPFPSVSLSFLLWESRQQHTCLTRSYLHKVLRVGLGTGMCSWSCRHTGMWCAQGLYAQAPGSPRAEEGAFCSVLSPHLPPERLGIYLCTRLQWVEAPTCLTQGSRRESLTRHSCAGFPTVSLPFPATLFSGTTFPSKPAANKTLYQALLWEEPG